ncbi:relaxase MobL [Catenibacterium sp. RTP21428st1_B8_RTP21428_210409]|uniref:relaxase MobL n=1 Tax=Catenibacterium sp. RTP21428st1_B8_RTP21428_210409 TaxID=3153689 RepID=UPI0032EC6AC0
MGIKIHKLRFLIYGYQPPKGSRFKGTLDTESLIGYTQYTDRDDAKGNEKKLGKRKDGYLGYTSSHHKDATISSEGVIDSTKKREELYKKMEKAFSKKGDIFYEEIISLESHEEAERLSLGESARQWEPLLNEVLPKVFRHRGFDPDNMLWTADLHTNTQHPHVHLLFMEKEHTIDRGKFTKSDMKYLKRQLLSALERRQSYCDRLEASADDVFRNKDQQFRHLMSDVEQSLLDNKNIQLTELLKALPKRGRMQYNSYNMKDYRPLIDNYIDHLIRTDKKAKASFEKLMETIDKLEANINDAGNEKISTLKEAEMRKIYERIGNMILQKAKDPDYKEIMTVNKRTGETQIRRYRKPLTNISISRAIADVANAQEQEMEEALEEFYYRASHTRMVQ